MELLFVLFLVAFVLNVRAAFKLGLDWKGMLTTVGFVREAYARLDELPGEEALERDPRAPVFLHLVPAYQEPDIAATVSALVGSRYPHGRLHSDPDSIEKVAREALGFVMPGDRVLKLPSSAGGQ